jgi:hypothetical protein
MRWAVINTCLYLIAVSGCVELSPKSAPTSPANAARPATVVLPTPPATKSTAVAADPAKSPAIPPITKASVAAKVAVPTPEPAKAPAKPAIVVATTPKPPATPALDLAALEQRLRDTHAIGVFTKLSLKNQVDDLLDQFRGFYKGQIKIPLAELRQRYDLLLLKVLSLLQDADQQLASAIASSREAIWGILADRDKFAKI